MLILLTGHTWYGKYCFRPYDILNNSIDKILTNKYENNMKIMNNITIYKSNINNYIRETKNEKLINAVNKLVSTNPDMLLKYFLTNFLKEYDKTCDYFIIFYDKLYDDIGLYDFHRLAFVKIL